MRFQGKLYRALNPVYARQPLSGQGAAHHGGRFNPKGMPTLYTALSVMTALREANQVGHLQPTTLVSYDAEIARVFDARNAEALDALGMDADAVAAPSWRDEMRDFGEARTQRLARQLVADGYFGLMVRSFAPGAGPGDLNLVLWAWGDAAPSRLVLIDDENRLG
jgi:RES domain-containing protein